jgi:hypothetical protein
MGSKQTCESQICDQSTRDLKFVLEKARIHSQIMIRKRRERNQFVMLVHDETKSKEEYMIG